MQKNQQRRSAERIGASSTCHRSVKGLGSRSHETAIRQLSMLDVFERQFAWLNAETKRLAGLERTAAVRRKMQELFARNAHLGKDIVRFMEAETA